jgi:hypothetical protein
VFDSSGKSSTFNYDSLEWPIDSLGTTQYPHYAVFYINETLKAEQSNLAQQNFTMGQNTTGSGTSKVAAGAITSVINGAVSAGNTVVNTVNKGTAYSNAALGTTLGQVNNIPMVDWTSTRKRLKQCICLPMPQKVRANYSASYKATDEIGAMGAVIAAAISPGSNDSMQTLAMAAAPTFVGMSSKVAQSVLSKGGASGKGTALGNALGGALAAATPSGKQVSQILSKISGKVINKRQEQLFENMEFRSHQFSYLFIPRSNIESDRITAILKEFKLHMHPDLNAGAGSSLLITPAEFDIEFRFMDTENTSISRIATCALKSCEINYTAIGEFVAFKDTPNPVAISLELTFQEMEPLNRDMIVKGF